MVLIICFLLFSKCLFSFCSSSIAKWHELLSVENKTCASSSSLLLIWYYPRSLHTGLGLYPQQLEAGVSQQPQCFLWAGPEWPSHHLQADQLPAAAPWGEPTDAATSRLVPAPQTAPRLRQTHDALLDDCWPAWAWPVCGLPVQRHCGELGEEEACVGDADGQLADGVGCPIQRDASAGSVLSSGGWKDEKDDRGCWAGGRAMSPPEWPQLFPGKRRNDLLFLPFCFRFPME